MTRVASIKERGDELSAEQWQRFEAAVDQMQKWTVRSAFGGHAGYFSAQAQGAEPVRSVSRGR